MSEFKPMDPNYEARVRSSFEKQNVMKTIGAILTRVAPGEVVIELSYDASLTQQHGYLHAGIVTTVVDSACGYAAYTLMAPASEVLTIGKGQFHGSGQRGAIQRNWKGITIRKNHHGVLWGCCRN